MTAQGAHSYETEVTLITGTVLRVREPPADVVRRVGVARRDPQEGLIDLTRDDGCPVTIVAEYVVLMEPKRETGQGPGGVPIPARR
jgi:hypothetical protein